MIDNNRPNKLHWELKIEAERYHVLCLWRRRRKREDDRQEIISPQNGVRENGRVCTKNSVQLRRKGVWYQGCVLLQSSSPRVKRKENSKTKYPDSKQRKGGED